MQNESLEQVQVSLLGAPRWRSSGEADVALSRKDAALLALLALDGEQPRDRVAAWLWPEVPLKSANVNLRQRLFKLRQATGHVLVDATATLRLASGVGVDVAGRACTLEGELLGGFDYGDHEALDAWVLAARERLARTRLDALVGQAAALEAQGALAPAIELCEGIVARAPLHEHAWRRLMRLHYLRGDRAGAIEAFERFERIVREEQGSRPSAETLELLQSIERMDARPAPGRSPLPASLVRPPVLVGRDAALLAMARAWELGRAVLVLGEGGIGKSRLMADFVHGRPGVLATRARPGDAAMPYATLTPLLRQALELYPPELSPSVRAELSRLLPALGAAPAGEGRQAVLWQAVEAALAQAAAQGLTAIMVDDLHFADAASIELLRWLLAGGGLSALRFGFGARPDEPEPATALLKDWTGDSSRVEPVHLLPLSPEQVQQFVDTLQLAGLAALPSSGPTLAQALFRHAGGHPFYTLETIKGLLLAGDAAVLPKPAAASAMIERRLERLPPLARDLLRLAALAGADLRLDVAAAVLQRPVMELAPAWAELESAQVMQGGGFAHDLVRECALALVPPPVRQALHGELAAVLQARGGTEPARLAQHWSEAGQWPAAAACLREAARAARIAGRLAEHEALLDRVALACERGGDAAGRFNALRDALAALMMRQGSEAALERASTLEPLATNEAQAASLLALRAEALLNLARYPQALAAADEALRRAPLGSATHSDAIALYGRGLALNGRPGEAMDLLRQACLAADALGDQARSVVAYSALAHASLAAGHTGDALLAQQQAVRLARQLGDSAEIAQTCANLATLASSAGDAATAYLHASEAERIFHGMGADGGHGVFNRIILARSAAHLGRLDEALQLLEGVARLGDGAAGITPHTMAQVALAGVRLWLGQVVEAGAGLPPPAPGLHPIAHAGLCLLRARADRWAGRDEREAVQALHALGEAQPELLDNPLLYLEWARFDAAPAAVERLQRLRAAAQASGAEGLARSLAVRAVERLTDHDPRAAAALAHTLQDGLALGLHPNVYPPEAWCTLARALQPGAPQAAAACRDEALRWLDAATLPAPHDAWREAFMSGNPVNHALFATRR